MTTQSKQQQQPSQQPQANGAGAVRSAPSVVETTERDVFVGAACGAGAGAAIVWQPLQRSQRTTG